MSRVRCPPFAAYVALLLYVAGCGRLAFDVIPETNGDDAGGDAPMQDGLPDAAMLGAFGPPTPVAELMSAADDEEPTFSNDLLRLAFRRVPSLVECTRATSSDPWGAPGPITTIDGPGTESEPGMTADGLTLYYTDDRAGTGDIWVTTRPMRSSAWTTPVAVAALNSASADAGPAVSADGAQIVFESKRSGANKLYIALRTGTTTFGAPALIEGVGSASTTETEGRLFDGGRGIVFASDRAGGTGLSDLYIATRPTPTGPFTEVHELAELDTTGNDWDPWISEDGRFILYAKNNGAGAYHLYQATR